MKYRSIVCRRKRDGSPVVPPIWVSNEFTTYNRALKEACAHWEVPMMDDEEIEMYGDEFDIVNLYIGVQIRHNNRWLEVDETGAVW